MLRNFSDSKSDYEPYIGYNMAKPNMMPLGKIVDIHDEYDAIWHNHKLYFVLESGEQILVNKIGSISPTTIQLARY